VPRRARPARADHFADGPILERRYVEDSTYDAKRPGRAGRHHAGNTQHVASVLSGRRFDSLRARRGGGTQARGTAEADLLIVQVELPTRVTLFDGVPPDELSRLFARLKRRRLDDGAILVSEGAHTHQMFVIDGGTADVFVTGSDGEQHHVSRLGPGGLLGEMALLTGQPASATVKAVGHLDVLAIDDTQFEAIAATYPRIYHNVGAIL